MSLATKNESLVPASMHLEPLTETLQTPPDVADVKTEVSDPPQSDSDGSLSRRPRNPFILFRTWYIKQGYLKQVTSSGSELSKITGKLWKAMCEDDRKYWAEQARLEREAATGRTYASATASKPRAARSSRKRAPLTSGVRYDPMATQLPNPTDERMDNIVQLIMAGKRGEELGGELRKKTLGSGESAPSSTAPVELSPPLLAPVPRSARSSVSVDTLELQSHLPRVQTDQDSASTSVSPNSSSQDLPATPEQDPVSGYGLASRRGSAVLNHQADPHIYLNATPDFMFSAPSLHDQSGSTETEVWSSAATLDACGNCTLQPQPAPTSHKDHSEAPHLVHHQGWNYYSTPVPVHGLNYLPGSCEVPVYPNYASYGLAPTASWHGPEFVSAYDVPGHTPSVHTGDLSWPAEWINDTY